jgi:predicted dehydrogenase
MGRRHIRAYKELQDAGAATARIVGVCDLRRDAAELAAKETEELTGWRPLVFSDPVEAVNLPDIGALDVTTDPATHHVVAIPALELGKHALVEKPLGVTVRACRAMVDAADRSGAILATAENYRRDPANRLAKGVIDAGLLGEPFLMIHNIIGGDDRIRITPWRHRKESGAIGLDLAAHFADIVQYYLGPFDQVYGQGLIVEPIRRRRDLPDSFPDEVEATGEDSLVAMWRMRSGALVQFVCIDGGRGNRPNRERDFQRCVLGREGSLHAPIDRSGSTVVLRRNERETRGPDILPLISSGFRLNEITERLFGRDIVEYDLPNESIDAKLLAIEIHDFAEAIMSGREPEVDGRLGMSAVAAILGSYESGLAGRSLTMDEIVSSEVDAYQAGIDEKLGLR